MKRRKRVNKKVIGIIIGAGVLCAAAISGIILYKTKVAPSSVSGNGMTGLESPTLDDLKNRRYIGDVIYTEPIKYPQLYDYPFKKTESYIRNKDLDIDKSKLVDTAKGFISDLYGKGYRQISAAPKEYEDKMAEYFDTEGFFITEFGPVCVDEDVFPKDYIESMSEHLVTNRVNAEAQLVTNASLVYADNYYWVRGMVELGVFNSDDKKLDEVETFMVDIGFKNASDMPHGYVVTYIQIVDTSQSPENP